MVYKTAQSSSDNLPSQEAQLSQRDCATLRVIEYFANSLKIIRNDTVRKQYFIETMSVCRAVHETFSVKEWRNLKTGGRGRSRSLKTALFDRSYTTLYWSAIVAVCCTIFKLFDVE